MKTKQIWVNAQNQVKRAGGKRASRNFETQREAFDFARKIAIKEELELIIQGKNARIRQRNSYGNDPERTKG